MNESQVGSNVFSFIHFWVKCFAVAILVTVSAGYTEAQSASGLGRTVTNVATVSFETDGGRITLATNPAVFTVEARRTDSTIEFFRFAPTSPGAIATKVNGSDFAPSGNTAGPFETIGAPVTGVGNSIDLSTPVPLAPAELYATGEVMFVRVIDKGQNGDSSVIETVSITIQTSGADEIVLRLYESGPDTGEFWAYVPTVRDATPKNDNRLTTASETRLTATYEDSFDATEVSVDTALVDPHCRVFNALTGDLVDGVQVTIMDAATGLPAQVLGVDGVSTYPAIVTTGENTSDSSGYEYEIRAGEFKFPILSPGEYYLELDTPEQFKFSSVYQPSQFTTLTNAPYTIEDAGSYGKSFVQPALGPMHFDMPIDPETDIVLKKSASPTIADVGDFIRYTVSVQNSGRAASTVRLHDIAPQGFRYLNGSSRLRGMKIADPAVASNGRELTYDLPVLQGIGSDNSYDLTYIMQIGADVREGEYLNTVFTLDRDGARDSVPSYAPVTVREELLRSTNTIIGRVAEYACDGDEDWAKEILDGTGVSGVRLYMETGEYTVTDEDGLYHFEGVSPGTHVVQVDEETLPKGYAAMMCEENSQYAALKTSKFIDNKGGGIWRANFYLARTGEINTDTGPEVFKDITEYQQFDKEWLETQTDAVSWVYPQEGRTPSTPSVNIGIKHGKGQTVSLALNDSPVPLLNFQARDSNKTRSVLMSRWRGVDVINGKNVFVATVKNADGSLAQTLRREIHFITQIARATPAPDQSVLVADGRTNPVIAVRIEDSAGRPVHAGRRLKVDVKAPYRLETSDRLENVNELVAPLSSQADAAVGANGIALIRLQPTLQTGSATVTVTLDDGRAIDVQMYLKPEKRDWIIIGLAEGSAGLEELQGNQIDLSDDGNDIIDGRVAFFAKGLVKGDWLMTLAVDTDKRRGDRDQDLFDEIDPNAYYTLYGDRSYQDHEARSRYPVYLKLEKNTFYAMFGDYNTDMNESELARYSRRLSGFKTEYAGERFDVVAFAAETNQGFAKDEIAANGTSGPYTTTFPDLLGGTEKIEIQTRDRFRSDIILETKTMRRHLDYTIDYLTGEIIFRLPVDVSDARFNPNVIVVDYETRKDAERNMTYGGRAAAHIAGGKVTVGASYIHEEGRAGSPNGKQDVVGIDMVARLSEATEIRAEYAMSKDAQAGSETVKAEAYMAEIVHTSDDFSAQAYIREEQAGFGVGQQGSGTAGIRRYGAGASYTLSEDIQEDTGRRLLRNIEGQSYVEESLQSGAKRILTEVSVSQEGEKAGGSLGLRHVKEEISSTEQRENLLAVGSARYSMPKHGLTATIAHEQPLSGDAETTLFPQRTTLGLDKTITTKAAVSLRHEVIEGQNASGQNTTLGVTYSPWNGTDVTAQTDMLTGDSARRLGATVGVDQQFKLNDKWSMATGISQRKILEDIGTSIDVVPDDAISPLDISEDYQSAYIGVGYRTSVTSASARLEARDSESMDTYIGTAGVARELSEELSVAGAARSMTQERAALGGQDAGTENRTDIRVGTAWRPRGEGLVVLDRFDFKYEQAFDGIKTTKLVNNMSANGMINDRTQVTGYWGIKHVETDIDGQTYDNWTNLLGGELRYDVTPRVDIGIHGQMITTGETTSYAYGPSIGVSPAENIWISVGYNVEGYNDDDFEAAEYSRDGAYLKLRLKFDQDTASKLLSKISPTGR